MEQEVWKDIKNFEGTYKISNKGRVKSYDKVIKRKDGVEYFKKGRILKPTYYSNGYRQLTIYKKSKRYDFIHHRVVAEHFIKNPYELPVIDHRNGLKDDNRAENLVWCTQKYNVRKAIVGKRDDSYLKGEKSHTTKHEKWKIVRAKNLFHLGFGRNFISNILGIPRTTLYYITSNKTWSDV